VEEKDLWSEELNVKEKEKSKKEREKNEAATLSFYQSYVLFI
jgi:hypothetical protein